MPNAGDMNVPKTVPSEVRCVHKYKSQCSVTGDRGIEKEISEYGESWGKLLEEVYWEMFNILEEILFRWKQRGVSVR